jgi:hypothetical protein
MIRSARLLTLLGGEKQGSSHTLRHLARNDQYATNLGGLQQ